MVESGAPLTRDITSLLLAVHAGDKGAVDQLIPHVYDELRALAASSLRRETPDHTLQATALAHEAYLKLVDQKVLDCSNRPHFLAIAATCIRRILLDHARGKHANKRGGADWSRVTLAAVDGNGEASGSRSPEALIALDDALQSLAEEDGRKARVIEMRYFGGLQVAEVADVLGVSVGTVERDLRMARAWLLRRLQSGEL